MSLVDQLETRWPDIGELLPVALILAKALERIAHLDSAPDVRDAARQALADAEEVLKGEKP
jgi:hypothetical protein